MIELIIGFILICIGLVAFIWGAFGLEEKGEENEL